MWGGDGDKALHNNSNTCQAYCLSRRINLIPMQLEGDERHAVRQSGRHTHRCAALTAPATQAAAHL